MNESKTNSLQINPVYYIIYINLNVTAHWAPCKEYFVVRTQNALFVLWCDRMVLRNNKCCSVYNSMVLRKSGTVRIVPKSANIDGFDGRGIIPTGPITRTHTNGIKRPILLQCTIDPKQSMYTWVIPGKWGTTLQQMCVTRRCSISCR